MDFIGFLQAVGIAGFFDIVFMWLLIYTLVVWAKKTRASSVLTGILIVAAFYLITRQFNLTLTSAIFEQFFAVILIALVVIFQEELRHFFEQLAMWTSLNRHVRKRQLQRIAREEVSDLVRTVHDLAKEKIGALIVIRGHDLIVRHLEGGVELNGKLSEALLSSIFDPSSIGHDGAVVIDGAQVTQFSTHLPLSKNLKKIGKGGTRHAAALGLSELSDALCIVVSEERGTISIARNGDMTVVRGGADKLTDILEKFYQEINPKKEQRPLEGYLRKNWKEKSYAFGLALLLWVVLVYGSKATYKTYIVPVDYDKLATPWKVSELEPKKIYVTLGGPRNKFYFLDKNDLRLQVSLPKVLGESRIRIYPTDLEFPKDLTLEVLAPQEIKVRLEHQELANTLSVGPVIGPEPKPLEEKPNGWRRIWPFGTRREIPENKNSTNVQWDTEPSVINPQVDAVQEEVELEIEKKVEPVEDLSNVEPEDVIKFLEESLDTETPIEPLRVEHKNGTDTSEKAN